jgi:hypothetical protein
MNRLRLRVVVGSVALILAVIVGVWFLWPGESPPVEQVEKQEETVSNPQANIGQTNVDGVGAAGRPAVPGWVCGSAGN